MCTASLKKKSKYTSKIFFHIFALLNERKTELISLGETKDHSSNRVGNGVDFVTCPDIAH